MDGEVDGLAGEVRNLDHRRGARQELHRFGRDGFARREHEGDRGFDVGLDGARCKMEDPQVFEVPPSRHDAA